MQKSIKETKLKLLKSFEGKIYDKTKIIDEELLRTICNISAEENAEIAVVIDRKGEVLNVEIGDSSSAEISLQNIDKHKICGIRVIHSHPFASSELSEKDLIFLKKYRLDMMIAVAVNNNGIKDATVAMIDNDNVNITTIDYAEYINKYGLMEKLQDILKKKKKNNKLIENTVEAEKAIIVAVDINKSMLNIEEAMEELEGLCKTDGIIVVGKLTQNRQTPDPKYLLGSGKIEELKDMIGRFGANIVIFENELTQSKQNNLSSYLNTKVIDRSMLILDIFAKRARTNEGKLQVELAQLKYMLPRLRSYIESSNKYGGGAGMRGPGETKLETNRRTIERNILKKSEELKKLKQQRDINRKRRRDQKPNVSIIGYTNSGKSTLLNLLAKDNIYAKDELFATLDTTSRNVWLGNGLEVVFTDTVGFINNLPHEFIEAFSSTLEECVYSDLLLLVADVSNPSYKSQIQVTLDVLKKIGADLPIMYVYNKIDKISPEEKKKLHDGICISAKTGEGVDTLKNKIIQFFHK